MLPPDEFIELAEVSGTIHRLTQHVSERASAEMRPLVDQHDLSLSVNLSTRNLYDAKLVEWVSDLLVRHRIAPGTLCFEITESQLMDDPSHSLTVLHELRELGIRFSIDDFGTGYSSLSYLRELPIDEVKIDRIFVADVANDDTIVRSVIDLGHNLGLHVVAEGVEDVVTLGRLQELGCDSAQGFHFGAPMDADELTTYLDGAWENIITLR
jgi:EAL domain-containing protein (putative c-di-GMP-specific phosphodiesterase class I)